MGALRWCLLGLIFLVAGGSVESSPGVCVFGKGSSRGLLIRCSSPCEGSSRRLFRFFTEQSSRQGLAEQVGICTWSLSIIDCRGIREKILE